MCIKEKITIKIDNFLFGDYVQVLFSSGNFDHHNAAFLQADLLEVSNFIFSPLKLSCNPIFFYGGDKPVSL